MGPLGYPEMIFIFVLALLLFGPKKLPELGRTLGKAMTEFRRASNELKATFDREMKTLEAENESLKEATREVSNSLYNNDTYNYDYSSYDSNYGYESQDSTATEPATTSASAPQGAESTTAANPPEGTVAQGTETATAAHSSAATPSNGAAGPEIEQAAGTVHPAETLATEHKA